MTKKSCDVCGRGMCLNARSCSHCRKHLKKYSSRPGIENKAIPEGQKKVQGSSYAAWKEKIFPKLLIVWEFEKKSHPIPRLKKRAEEKGRGKYSRDLSGIIKKYSIYYLKDNSIVMSWVDEPSHLEITKMEVTDELAKELSKLVDQQKERYPDALIVLAKSFRNRNNKGRIQVEISDHSKLPPPPKVMQNSEWFKRLKRTLDEMKGAEILLKKFNRPGLEGDRVFITGKILEMEDSEKQRTGDPKSSKDHGELYIILEADELVKLESWEKESKAGYGREDHWLGHAIDFLMEHLDSDLSRASSKEIGTDILPYQEEE